MALVPIEDQERTGDDLPWINDYLDGEGEPGDTFLVKRVAFTRKGLLVETSKFKGFLFTNSGMYEFLLEALELWEKNATYAHPLFAVANKSGKLGLAIDDEGAEVKWTGSKKSKAWTQNPKSNGDSGSQEKPSNPLLPYPPLTTPSKKGTSK